MPPADLARRRAALATTAALTTLWSMTLPSAASASEWPDRPITLIVPFVAGGTTDIIARALGQRLSQVLHQPVLIDNRGGAGGTLGASLASKAPSDGNTLFMATIAHAIAPGIYKNLSYDFLHDFDPVALVATTPNIVIVNAELPVRSIAELVAYAKAHPGQINYGSAGIGSTEHLSGELFRAMTETELSHVPYKGGAPMMAALVAGQIQMAIETSASAAPHIRAGQVRALAVTSAQREPAFPELPTLRESGLSGYEVTTWFALMAPHGTPGTVVRRLNSDVASVLAAPDLVQSLAAQGVSAGAMTPGELASFLRAETARWVKTAQQAGAGAE